MKKPSPLLSICLLSAALLGGCSLFSPEPPRPTVVIPTAAVMPTQLPTQPTDAGATAGPPTPSAVPSSTPLPLVNQAPENLPKDCWHLEDAQPIVTQYLNAYQQESETAAWSEFVTRYGQGLIYSIYDPSNTYAHYTTYKNMLLLGEYRFAVQRGEGSGHGYCSVVMYYGQEAPEIGILISDILFDETWSGFSYGRTASEAETRQFISENIGKAITVRFIVTRDPQDDGRVRPGFLSKTMRTLWADSYYTAFQQDVEELKKYASNPKVPTIQELMRAAQERKETGVFLDFMADPR